MKKKMIKKFVSGVTVMSLILASVPFNLYAATDTTGHWAKTYMDKLVSEKVLTGDPSGALRPDKAITRAEFITMMNKVFGYVDKNDNTFTDVSSTDWFLGEMQKATKAGYIAGYTDGTAKPNGAITRQEAAFAMWKAFGLTAGSSDTLKKFSDSSSIQDYARDAVASLVEHNAISGYPEGNFKPAGTITRAEASTILARFADVYSTAGTYGDSGSTISGNLVVNTPDVILSGMTINGDLYIAPGVDEGDATLNNVVVKGTTYVQGGGVNSVKVIDSKLKDVKVKKVNNKPVRVLAQGKTDIGTVTLGSSAKLVESGMNASNQGFNAVQVSKMIEGALSIILDGAFTTVNMASSGDFQLASGTISSMQVPAGVVVTVKTGTGAVISSISAVSPITVNGTAVSSNSTVGVSSTGNVSTSTGNNSNGGYSGGGSSGGGYGGGSGVVTTPTTALLSASLNFPTTTQGAITYLKVTGNGTAGYMATAANVKSIVMAGTSTNVSGAASVSTISATNGTGIYSGQVQLNVGSAVPVGTYTVNYADSALTGTTTKQSVVLTVKSATTAPTTSVTMTATPNGTPGTLTTTNLMLKFTPDIPGLGYNDFTIIPGVTSAVKGGTTSFASLGSGNYGLSLSGITASGQIMVSVANKAGYTLTTNPVPVVVASSNVTSVSSLQVANITATPFAVGSSIVTSKNVTTSALVGATASIQMGEAGGATGAWAVGQYPVATITYTASTGFSFAGTTWAMGNFTAANGGTVAGFGIDTNGRLYVRVTYAKLEQTTIAANAITVTSNNIVSGSTIATTNVSTAAITGATNPVVVVGALGGKTSGKWSVGDVPMATITFTAKTGYVFAATGWTATGATGTFTAVTSSAGTQLIVKATYPELTTLPIALSMTQVEVSASSLMVGKVIASTKVTPGAITGASVKTIVVSAGDVVDGSWAGNDVPKIVITYIPNEGYTFADSGWDGSCFTAAAGQTIVAAVTGDDLVVTVMYSQLPAVVMPVVGTTYAITTNAAINTTIANSNVVAPTIDNATAAVVVGRTTGVANPTAWVAGDVMIATLTYAPSDGFTFAGSAWAPGKFTVPVGATVVDTSVKADGNLQVVVKFAAYVNTAIAPTSIAITTGNAFKVTGKCDQTGLDNLAANTITNAAAPVIDLRGATGGNRDWMNEDVPVATITYNPLPGFTFGDAAVANASSTWDHIAVTTGDDAATLITVTPAVSITATGALQIKITFPAFPAAE